MLDKLIRVTATLVLLGTVLGCDSNEDESSSSQSESDSQDESKSSGVQAAPNDQQELGDSLKKSDEALAKKVKSQAKMKQAIGDAIKAATGAQKGDTPCATAFNAMTAMAQSMDKSTGQDNKDKLPGRKEFVAKCKELPETVQKCMAPSYMMKHRKECDQAKKNMSPDVQKKMAELMKKKGS